MTPLEQAEFDYEVAREAYAVAQTAMSAASEKFRALRLADAEKRLAENTVPLTERISLAYGEPTIEQALRDDIRKVFPLLRDFGMGWMSSSDDPDDYSVDRLMLQFSLTSETNVKPIAQQFKALVENFGPGLYRGNEGYLFQIMEEGCSEIASWGLYWTPETDAAMITANRRTYAPEFSGTLEEALTWITKHLWYGGARDMANHRGVYDNSY